MIQTYVLEQMVNLTHAPFQLITPEGRTKISFGMRTVEQTFYENNPQILQKAIALSKDYPVIFSEKKLLFVIIPDTKDTSDLLLVGPVTFRTLNREQLIELRRHWNMGKTDYQPPVTSMKKLVSMVLLLYWQITGISISATEFWEKNKEKYLSGTDFEERLSQELFLHQENVSLHNPYEQELRELNSISTGDIEALEKSMSETYEGEIGILAKDPLRSAKNVAIGNVTLASRAAIRGGMSVEKSFSLADSFIQQVEDIENIPEIEVFKREMKLTYARMVTREQNNETTEGENLSNPLIAQVKDYVFHHLHGAIQVQDIAFYLGFSSQSHFAKIFQEVTGMKPNAYRKTYGNQKKWHTKTDKSS